MILSGMFSSCSAMFQGGTQIILGTSFTAKEEDIIGADNDYKALEAALRNKINNIERTHSGYDEYRYDLDEINHNPYELAAYLTVKFEDYTRDEVQATLQWLFEQQYELTLTEVVEIRTRTTSSTDPETGETTTEEEDYEYYILNVKLRNKGLNSVISNSGLSKMIWSDIEFCFRQGATDRIFSEMTFTPPLAASTPIMIFRAKR